MNVRAVIFDVYGTLLEVGPPHADTAQKWDSLWTAIRNGPPVSFEVFRAYGEQIIHREHDTARGRGILYPEVYWPAVAKEALPVLATLSESELDEFLFQCAQLQHSVRLAAGASCVLSSLAERRVLLGVASNSQPYTVREFQSLLTRADLDSSIFQPDLCFWSFQHGFSKPDPHVFQFLTARLLARGIRPQDTLMVGDRLDNDIEPAKVHGWQTWHLQPTPDGGWACLHEMLSHRQA